MMKHILLIAALILALTILTGCGDTNSSLIRITIGDAAHGGPDSSFYLLPPLVEEPLYDGEFDATLSPVISITDLDIEYTTEVKNGSEYIRVVPEDELYILNWRTETEVFDLETPGIYRMSFLLDGVEIGFLEIQVYENIDDVLPGGDELNTMINPGRTLPIKFRLEKSE